MATCAIHHRVFLSEVGCPLCVSTPELTGSTAFAAENHALKARLAELESKLSAYRNRSLESSEYGVMCLLCKGSWSHTRGAEWHEDDCPNKEPPK